MIWALVAMVSSGCAGVSEKPLPERPEVQPVSGRLRTFPDREDSEPPIFREVIKPLIVDYIPNGYTHFRILGECDATLVALWEDDAGVFGPEATTTQEHNIFGRSLSGGGMYLLGLDRDSGQMLWRQDGGWSSSGIVRTEGSTFWHVQQACQVSLFAVKRRAVDGLVSFAVDLTALPPFQMGTDFGGSSAFHAAFSQGYEACALDRHLHRSPAAESRTNGDGRESSAGSGSDDWTSFVYGGMVLNDATYALGSLWMILDVPGWTTGAESEEVLAGADLSRGIWAWYLNKGEREYYPGDIGVVVPEWGKPSEFFHGVPVGSILGMTRRRVVGEDGTTYALLYDFQEEEGEAPWKGEHVMALAPLLETGLLDGSRRIVHKPVPPLEHGGAFWRIFAWSPYVVVVWTDYEKDDSSVLYVDLLSVTAERVTRIGPFKAEGEEVLFAAQDEQAVLAAGAELFKLVRSTPDVGGMEVSWERLPVSRVPRDGGLIRVSGFKDVRIVGDRIYAAAGGFREGADNFERKSYVCVACWSVSDGALLWVSDVEQP